MQFKTYFLEAFRNFCLDGRGCVVVAVVLVISPGTVAPAWRCQAHCQGLSVWLFSQELHFRYSVFSHPLIHAAKRSRILKLKDLFLSFFSLLSGRFLSAIGGLLKSASGG